MGEIISTVVACLVVALVVTAGLCGWPGAAGGQRHALSFMAAGLVLAAAGRFFGRPPGFGDIVFLGGLAAYLVIQHGGGVIRHLDRCDGVEDGRLDVAEWMRKTTGRTVRRGGGGPAGLTSPVGSAERPGKTSS